MLIRIAEVQEQRIADAVPAEVTIDLVSEAEIFGDVGRVQKSRPSASGGVPRYDGEDDWVGRAGRTSGSGDSAHDVPDHSVHGGRCLDLDRGEAWRHERPDPRRVHAHQRDIFGNPTAEFARCAEKGDGHVVVVAGDGCSERQSPKQGDRLVELERKPDRRRRVDSVREAVVGEPLFPSVAEDLSLIHI